MLFKRKTLPRQTLPLLCLLAALMALVGCRRTAAAPDGPAFFRVSEVAYADARYSWYPTPEQAPLYSLAGDGTLYEIRVETGAQALGTAMPVFLKKENFDALFTFPDLSENAPAALRKNSRYAFGLQSGASGTANTDTYLFTKQNDGAVYLACGYAGEDGSQSHIRFLYRLEALSAEELSALLCELDPLCMDAALLDLDGDGAKELCMLQYGRTSGLFSFTLCARKDGRLDGPYLYKAPFFSEAGTLSFLTKDGTPVVRLSPQAAPDAPIDYTACVLDGSVSLQAGDTALQPLTLSGAD